MMYILLVLLVLVFLGSINAFVVIPNQSLNPIIHHHDSVRFRFRVNNSNDKVEVDATDRRDFLIAASSVITAVTILTSTSIRDSAIAVEAAVPDDSSIIPTSATTPSIAEGELTFSEPPPNRAKVTTVDHPTNNNLLRSSDPRFFIAGGVSAAFSHGITTPIDVVKTKIQADPQFYSGVGLQQATLSIIKKDGPKVLLGGLGPTVVGYGIEGALKFGVYESLKPAFIYLFYGTNNALDDPTKPYLAAAVCAGALASIILCPMEETRIRLVTDPTFDSKGLLDGLPRLIREEGFFSPFSGLGAMLTKQVPYTMAKQVSFDVFASMLYTGFMTYTVVSLPQTEIAFGIEIGAAFLASVIACIASHPGDVLLTATYNQGNRNDNDTTTNSRGLRATISNVYNDGGIQAFFRGINARFVHVACIITFQLVIYDQIKQVLGLPASGLPGTS